MYTQYVSSRSSHTNMYRREVVSRSDLHYKILCNGGTVSNLDFSNCDFSNADLSNLDLYTDKTYDAPTFRNAVFNNGNLTSVRLHGADLSNSRFFRVDLKHAELSVVDLSNSDLTDADLSGADLYLARLSGAILNNAKLHNTDLSETLLDGAYISGQEVIGNSLLQENEVEYEKFLMRYKKNKGDDWIRKKLKLRYYQAGKIYRNLEQCFARSGNYLAANWAYRRARHAERIWSYQRFTDSDKGKSGKYEDYKLRINYFTKWVSDCIVESICDYGESSWRVIAWIGFIIFAIGPAIFVITGSFEWSMADAKAYSKLDNPLLKQVYIYFQYVLYMIDTFATTGFADITPSNDITRMVSGLMALVGIFLIGLLGFVAGNRIRHS